MTNIKNKEGTIISDEYEITKISREYFMELIRRNIQRVKYHKTRIYNKIRGYQRSNQ